jgi:hypothetical protein
MKKKSATMIAGALVAALMAGMVSREMTISHAAATAAAAKPVAVVAQAPAAAAPVYSDEGGNGRDS